MQIKCKKASEVMTD